MPLMWKEGSKSNVNLLNFSYNLIKIILIYFLFLKFGIDRRYLIIKNNYKKLEYKYYD